MTRSRAAFLSGISMLAGCAHAPASIEGASSADEGRVLIEVPFFPDRTDQCGPAALASLLGFWGEAVEPSELKREIYLARLRGSLPIDLYLAARGHGFQAKMASGSLAVLKTQLNAGRPAIAFLNRGYRFYPIGHYIVITGYDERRQGLYAHSGARRNAFLSYKRFSVQWEKTRRWTLLI